MYQHIHLGDGKEDEFLGTNSEFSIEWTKVVIY